MPLLVDAHQDLAWNALSFGRDYTQSALVTRRQERDGPVPSQNGNTTLGLTEFLLGRTAIIFNTLFASPARTKLGAWDKQCYTNAKEAHQAYAAQLDYYSQLVQDHEHFWPITTRTGVDKVLETWRHPDLDQRRIGLVTLMEGADCVLEPKEIHWWMERGVRIVGPAWSGTRYAGGTGEPGPLTPEGRQLLAEMADLGLILDLSHMSDESCLEALDRYPGTLIATHANPRARLKYARRPERHLTDEMIRRIAERDGVIGVVLFNRFLKDWSEGDGKSAVTLNDVVAAIDHICQLVGSARHVGIGSDFDGGFGVEKVPAELDTIADVQKLAPLLLARGYTEPEVDGIFGQNWIAVLKRGLPA